MLPGATLVFNRAGAGLDASTTAWVNAVVTNGGSVSAGRQTLVNTLIVGLKSDGIFIKLDRLWLFAAENTPSALTDIIADSLATTVSSPTFTIDLGFTGNGSSNYIDSNFNASTAGGNYALNSASLFGWSNTTTQEGVPFIGGDDAITALYPYYSDTNRYFKINDSSFATAVVVGTAIGFHHANRSASNATQGYTNGSQVATGSPASISVSNTDFLALRGAGNFWSGQMCAFGFGGSLSSTDANNLYSRLRTYMTAVGVP